MHSIKALSARSLQAKLKNRISWR